MLFKSYFKILKLVCVRLSKNVLWHVASGEHWRTSWWCPPSWRHPCLSRWSNFQNCHVTSLDLNLQPFAYYSPSSKTPSSGNYFCSLTQSSLSVTSSSFGWKILALSMKTFGPPLPMVRSSASALSQILSSSFCQVSQMSWHQECQNQTLVLGTLTFPLRFKYSYFTLWFRSQTFALLHLCRPRPDLRLQAEPQLWIHRILQLNPAPTNQGQNQLVQT